MILNDKQIIKEIRITNGVSEKVQKGTLLEKEGLRITSSYGIDPQGYTFRLALDSSEIAGRITVIPSFKSVQLDSYEVFELPSDVCAFMYGKSSFTRSGLIFSFAVVDAGYHGRIGFSVFNPTLRDVWLPVEQGIAQIVFHRMDAPDKAYEGAWQDYKVLGNK